MLINYISYLNYLLYFKKLNIFNRILIHNFLSNFKFYAMDSIL